MPNDKPLISIEALAKRYPTPDGKGDTAVFEDLWLRIDEGEFVCVIGHSGCGKTTLLNILAGLESASAGGIILSGTEITEPNLDRAVIFQSHALLPWMSVLGNVAFAVRSKWPQMKKAELRAHCLKYLDLVHLGGNHDKRPAQLSGGMRQRVGIARAFAIQPKVMLMDEPFSALDALTRGTLQDELLTICAETNQTSFMITHDIDEAIFLADKIVLMTNGPQANIAEIVRNPLPRSRQRDSMHRDPHYYPLRNHLLDFLVTRSSTFKETMAATGYDPRNPPIVEPRLAPPAAAPAPPVAEPFVQETLEQAAV
jgi:nitrate/nitrite transport system ATP-binding protein